MGFDVHIHVAFNCCENEPVAQLAANELPKLPEYPREAHWFLEELSQRTGTNKGPKGGLSLWGIVGNYTDPDEFVQALLPFFEKLLEGNEIGPCTHEHIVVLSEKEQSEQAQAHEIYWESESRGTVAGLEMRQDKLVVKKYDLPFAWMQF